ncbi:hypothetical protein A3D81_02760 [Candidatus Curtissbacteria bacterium RIFCSPHIGHO2_02_FULL_40_17]|uniref:MGS-like domain-containing protein n=3 Tax=Candidatus Curtissiibacteriota TaxID=1752717 RepID=A0A1F5GIT7_9BACT|nr:MAG: hypothetical protein A2693_04085 [Candidatus Curtissbacteria bacterium RIFCSPHIGHO2_01_FULL_40_12]OGD91749.1 MAG: hypothetical protein A3D81_02760 [Candidatus Curtissbacteria bacterium RIFCSPHIGHO2_02_FULL_40_17]OGE03979.1 MAG: hypothetical protein A3F45_03400 [Candidatus Curtissbacteria bacterium RIFCSPHIGHO2_12_FULL_41_17]
MKIKIKNILIAVSVKSSIDGVLPVLKEYGVRIWATEGTANYIKSKGYKATSIVSGFDFDGRVKSLDKNVFVRILADRSNKKHLDELRKLASYSSSEAKRSREVSLAGSSRPFNKIQGKQARTINTSDWEPFDAVVVELYKLDETNFPESMDIGGMTLIRAAIKNFSNIALAFDEESIKKLTEHLKINTGSTQSAFRTEQVKKASRFVAQRCNLEAEMF